MATRRLLQQSVSMVLFIGLYTVAYIVASYGMGFLLHLWQVAPFFENLIRLLSGIPICVLLVWLGVRYLPAYSFPIVVMGFVLLLVVPFSVGTVGNLVLLSRYGLEDISTQSLLRERIDTRYFQGKHGTGGGGSRSESDVFQVLLPLTNGNLLVFETRSSHEPGQKAERLQQAMAQAVQAFEGTQTRYAARLDRILIGSSGTSFRRLDAQSPMRRLVASPAAFFKELAAWYLLAYSLGLLAVVGFVVYAFRTDNLELR